MLELKKVLSIVNESRCAPARRDGRHTCLWRPGHGHYRFFEQMIAVTEDRGMAGNHEPNRKYGKWKADSSAPVSESTRAYWKKTGRYPQSSEEMDINDDSSRTPDSDASQNNINWHSHTNHAGDATHNVPTLDNMIIDMDLSARCETESECRELSSEPDENESDTDSADPQLLENCAEERRTIENDNEDQYAHLIRADIAEVPDIVVSEEPFNPKVSFCPIS
ncbi:hypothetical protein QAD02_013322 [Eretmocerus hayati]|uniref:Uncharacterized protein n=1 Tax=Eretmocerus hayati TaxID=131215 RepID=A0ACC2P6W0_9HYME|nr:hypothetical protein QAD02_013322 [Eretmocerus hayati]